MLWFPRVSIFENLAGVPRGTLRETKDETLSVPRGTS